MGSRSSNGSLSVVLFSPAGWSMRANLQVLLTCKHFESPLCFQACYEVPSGFAVYKLAGSLLRQGFQQARLPKDRKPFLRCSVCREVKRSFEFAKGQRDRREPSCL